MSDTVQLKSTKPKIRWSRWVLFVLVGGILAGTGAKIYAHPPSFIVAAHCRFASADPEAATRCVDAMVRVLMSKIDASDEQRTKINGIVNGAINDLRPVREKHREGHERAGLLLSQPSIDRAAFESLRVEQMQLAETASRRIVQTLTDVAEVLTPEQRVALVEHIREMRNGHPW